MATGHIEVYDTALQSINEAETIPFPLYEHSSVGEDLRLRWCFLFFFFQAEDGIRDADVTGVQTCALPIYPACYRHCPRAGRPGDPAGHQCAASFLWPGWQPEARPQCRPPRRQTPTISRYTPRDRKSVV